MDIRGALGVAAVVLLAGCSPSDADLADEVEDESGVVRVQAQEVQGDDFIPFADPPASIWVRMEAGVDAEEALAVFDAYDDEIDDDHVDSVEVRLEGPKKATLLTGTRVHATEVMAEDLVAAQADDDVLHYHRLAGAAVREVELEVVQLEFADVRGVADRYGDRDDIDIVSVVSGPFLLIRDSVNEDLSRTSARETLTLRVDRRFRLNGASVAGRGPLVLNVAPDDRAAVERFVALRSGAGVGKVVVRGRGGPRP